MDILLLRTFLEVSAAGTFGGAAEKLSVTQSAVSVRIQRLEEQIGHPLFTRSKAGAVQTPAGREFQRYARSIIQTWEMARQQVAIPEGFMRSITIGAQYSLWPRLGFSWIDGLRAAFPDLAIRADLGMPDRLTRLMLEGTMQAALMYTPTIGSGLAASRLLEDELVLVAAWPDPTEDLRGRYVHVDWGREIAGHIGAEMPDLAHAGLTLGLGALSTDYIVRRGLAAYLPARSILHHLQDGLLHRVPGAPAIPFPVWSVWRDDADPEIVNGEVSILRHLATGIDAEVDGLRPVPAASRRIDTQKLK